MKNYLSLATKYLIKQKKTSLMTILSIVIGTFVICATLIVIDTINRGRRDEAIFYGNYDVQFKINDSNKMDKILEHENVNSYSTVSKDVYGYILKKDEMEFQHQESDSYETAGYEFVASVWTFDKPEQDVFTFSMIEGSEPKCNGEIIIPKNVVDLFDTPKKVGDIIDFDEREYKISGIYDAKKSSCKYTDDNFVYMYAVDSNWSVPSEEKYVDIYTKLKDHSDLINKAFLMGSSLELVAGEYFPNYEMASLVYYQSGTLLMLILIIVCAMFLIIYVAMVIIRNNFSINVTERIRDYGILKGIGASNNHLCRLFIVENALAGMIGIVIGIIGAYGLTYKVFSDMINNGEMNFFYSVKISPLILVVTIAILVITLVLAGIEPFLIMKKTQITQAINKNYAINNEKNKIVKSRFLRFLGIEGEYAYKNARRNSKAFFTVVTSFVIAIIIYIAFAGFTNSFFNHLLADNDEHYDAELEVENYNMTSAEGKKICDHLEKSKYFDEAELMKSMLLPGCDVELKDKEGNSNSLVYLSIYNKEEIKHMKEHIISGSKDYDKLSKEGIIVIKSDDYNLNIGDTVEIITDKSFYSEAISEKNYSLLAKAQEICENKGIEFEKMSKMTPIFAEEYEHKAFNIAAIAEDSLYMDTEASFLQVIMTQEYFDSIAGKNVFNGYNNKFVVKTSAKADIQSINTFLLSLDDDAYVYFFNEEWEFFQSVKSIKNKVNYVILGIAAIGVFYIINSLASEQLRRKNEFSILRSVGMNKKQMIKMILFEKGLMCIIAYIIGIILGNIISYAWVTQMELVEEGLTYVIPVKEMILTLVAMLIVTVVSSIIPILTMKKSTQLNSLQ